MKTLNAAAAKYNSISLIVRILCGLVIGAVLALTVPGAGWVAELGTLFVGALKGIAPVLVFVIVASALAQGSSKLDRRFATVIWLYMLTTFLAAAIASVTSFLFPVTVVLADAAESDVIPAGSGRGAEHPAGQLCGQPRQRHHERQLHRHPVLGLPVWPCHEEDRCREHQGLPLPTRLTRFPRSSAGSSTWLRSASWVWCTPTLSSNGLSIFTQYGKLLALLVGTMLFMALIVSPLIMFLYLGCNPYPLVFRCLKESGLTAFFTRSSAANIPVNMALCEKLGLDKDMYSVSIPLGATINMDGAAITITIMTLAAANTLGIQVSLPAAVVLSAMSALGACGASGVAGGSLLLIPMACSLFGISNDIAMQMVGVGFIIGVVQDSVETALNSAGDVEFAATAEYHQWRKEGKPLPDFLQKK